MPVVASCFAPAPSSKGCCSEWVATWTTVWGIGLYDTSRPFPLSPQSYCENQGDCDAVQWNNQGLAGLPVGDECLYFARTWGGACSDDGDCNPAAPPAEYPNGAYTTEVRYPLTSLPSAPGPGVQPPFYPAMSVAGPGDYSNFGLGYCSTPLSPGNPSGVDLASTAYPAYAQAGLDFSVSVWFRADFPNFVGGGPLFDVRVDTSGGLLGGAYVVFRMELRSGPPDIVLGNTWPNFFTSVLAGSWHMITLTSTSPGFDVYVDGVLVPNFHVTGSSTGACLGSGVAKLLVTDYGNAAVTGTLGFEDLRVLSRGLSAVEVAALFAAGPNGPDAIPPVPNPPASPPLPSPYPAIPIPPPPYPPPVPPTPRYIPPAPNPGNTCVQTLFTCQYLLGVATWVQTSAACVPNAQCAPQSLVVDGGLLYFEQQGGCPLNVLPSPLPAVPPIAAPYPYLLNPLQPLVTIPAPCAPLPFDGCLKTTHSCQCLVGGAISTPVWVLDSAVCVPGTQCQGVSGPNPDAQGAYRQEHPSVCYLGQTVPSGLATPPPIAPDCCRCCKDWSATCAGGVWTVTRSAEACNGLTVCASTAWVSVQPDSCAMTRRTQGATSCASQAACANNTDQPPDPTPALTVPACCAP